MNKQTTYEHIRQIRDKMFPPELEFGCEVEWSYVHTEGGNRWRRYKTGFVIRGNQDYRGSKYPQILINLEDQITNKKVSEKEIVLLGRPVSLNEILLMIKNHKAYIDCPEMALQLMAMLVTSSDFDLTKSIQDQTPEVLEDILKIID